MSRKVVKKRHETFLGKNARESINCYWTWTTRVAKRPGRARSIVHQWDLLQFCVKNEFRTRDGARVAQKWRIIWQAVFTTARADLNQ